MVSFRIVIINSCLFEISTETQNGHGNSKGGVGIWCSCFINTGSNSYLIFIDLIGKGVCHIRVDLNDVGTGVSCPSGHAWQSVLSFD